MSARDSRFELRRPLGRSRIWLVLLVVLAVLFAARVVGTPDEAGPRLPASFLQR